MFFARCQQNLKSYDWSYVIDFAQIIKTIVSKLKDRRVQNNCSAGSRTAKM